MKKCLPVFATLFLALLLPSCQFLPGLISDLEVAEEMVQAEEAVLQNKIAK